jgi:hypothetical protein
MAVDWNAVGALASAGAAIVALGIAVGVPWRQDVVQRRERIWRAYGIATLFAKLLDEGLAELSGCDLYDRSIRANGAHTIDDLLRMSSSFDMTDLTPASAEAFVRARSIALAARDLLLSASSSSHVANVLTHTTRKDLSKQWAAIHDGSMRSVPEIEPPPPPLQIPSP